MPRLTSVSLYTRINGKYTIAPMRGIYAEGTVFVLRYEKDRRRVWETLDAKDFAEARKLCLEKELALASPPQPKPLRPAVKTLPAVHADSTNLSAAIDRHIDALWSEGELMPKTIRQKQQILRQFASANPAIASANEIGRPDLMQYKDRLMSEGNAERTANNKLVHVVSFLHACGMRDILTKKDWRSFKAQGRRNTRSAYTKVEIAALRKVATEDERDVLEFLVGTGMRKNQAVQTRWSDVDFLNRVVSVPDGVGTTEIKKARAAKLGTELLARLEARRLRHPDTTYVFETKNGTPDDHIDRMVTNAAERAGINLAGKSVLHSLRKTFATRLLNSGYDMYRVSKLLGHANISTTELYASFDADSESAGDDIERALAAGV